MLETLELAYYIGSFIFLAVCPYGSQHCLRSRLHFMFLSDEGPTLETYRLHFPYIGSTPIFLYFDLYLNTGHYVDVSLWRRAYVCRNVRPRSLWWQYNDIFSYFDLSTLTTQHTILTHIHTDRQYIYTQTDTIYTHRQTRTHTQIGIRSSRAYAKRGIFEVHAESFHFRTLCRNFNKFFFLVTCHANTAIQSEIKKATKYHFYSAITESHLIRCLCRIIMCFDTIGGLWINSGTCQTAFCWLGC